MPAPLDALEQLADGYELSSAPPTKRMLVIVNPYATTVSDRLKHLVVYALRGRYEVTAVDTDAKGHATELCREAALEGYDVVVAFGGDGTVNEAANGLAGTGVPLTCLPGGSTNVFCRLLGIPNDPVDATEHLLRVADEWQPRAVDLGRINGRAFTFTAGIGLDASVVERVDRRPRLKARLGPWFYTAAAIATFNRRYLINPPRMTVRLGTGETIDGVTAIVQNSDPYTYFGKRIPVHLAEGGTLDSGELVGVVLRRASPLDMPTVIYRALLSKRARIVKHRQVDAFEHQHGLRITAHDGRELDMQVDGDYIGAASQIEIGIEPGALTVVS